MGIGRKIGFPVRLTRSVFGTWHSRKNGTLGMYPGTGRGNMREGGQDVLRVSLVGQLAAMTSGIMAVFAYGPRNPYPRRGKPGGESEREGCRTPMKSGRFSGIPRAVFSSFRHGRAQQHTELLQ